LKAGIVWTANLPQTYATKDLACCACGGGGQNVTYVGTGQYICTSAVSSITMNASTKTIGNCRLTPTSSNYAIGATASFTLTTLSPVKTCSIETMTVPSPSLTQLTCETGGTNYRWMAQCSGSTWNITYVSSTVSAVTNWYESSINSSIFYCVTEFNCPPTTSVPSGLPACPIALPNYEWTATCEPTGWVIGSPTRTASPVHDWELQ
jgi:hypothetical protein